MNAPSVGPLGIGRIGIWRRSADLTPALAEAAEAAGHGAAWVGGSPTDDLAGIEELLAATARIVIAPAVVSIWANDAARLAASYKRVTRRFGDRVLLGVGSGRRERAGAAVGRTTFSALGDFLGRLADHGVPRQRVIVGALGPRTLRLASAQTAGAHTYLVTPRHTRTAREIVGPGALLVPEHKVCLTDDPDAARALARSELAPYFKLGNYRASLLREGFSEADLDMASDRVLDAVVLNGDASTVAGGLRAHFDAGADHVAVRVMDLPGQDPAATYRALATANLTH
ncbi:MAG TPA: TIGR03620 family F420-dependent LLM class oxidoreductase [Trebonia sp.]|nr:TIGR03620 family F420-dependent LLM class oxidoreductase [Trebonia sp.]